MLGGGGNALAFLRDEGVVLIDSKGPGWGGAVAEAVAAATDRSVTTLVYTHAHADHTGGGASFAGVTEIVAHENASRTMARMDEFSGERAKFLPTTIVRDRLTLLEGRDRIELHYFGRGHTDGDLVVVFPERRLAYFGDLFPAKAAPVIDTAAGGSGLELPETLEKAVSAIAGVSRVITGHEEGLRARRDPSATSVDISTPGTMTWADLQEYAAFTRDFVDAVRAAKEAGRTAPEAASSLSLPDRYKDYDLRGAGAAVAAIYRELDGR
jgi:glyoxylase-like metal-dependent hydrolase (beta-lactamase superfamily II)